MQEVPAEHRAHDPSYTIAPYETYAQYNARSCGQQGPLKTCFPEDALLDILYGTLSHCHLLLVLLCLPTGATWELPEKLAKLLLNTDGTINYAAVAADATAQAARYGAVEEVERTGREVGWVAKGSSG